jgi:hypothetical protein
MRVNQAIRLTRAKPRVSLLIVVAMLYWLLLHAMPVRAQAPGKKCPGAEVSSIDISTETGADWPLATKATIDATPQGTGQQTFAVTVYGPILASAMNLPEVKTEWDCMPGGLLLEVTIAHLGSGDAAKNALYRPKISFSLDVREKIIFRTVWKMRSPDGEELDHARAPPYPEQHYPIEVAKTLGSGHQAEP